MITFGSPYLESGDDSVRVLCAFEDDSRKGEIFFGVSLEYGDFLCTERSDAYVIAALPYAMRTRQDIICDAPVTEDLLFQIETELVPAMTKKSTFYPAKIFADTAPILAKKPFIDQRTGQEKIGAVGTGFSLGTDSFYAVASLQDDRFPSQQLTHLAQHNVGAFNTCYRQFGRLAAKNHIYEETLRCAEELGIPLLQTDSNLKKIMPGDFQKIATFNNAFAVYCMQELWAAYHLGSHGAGLTPLNFNNMQNQNSAFYDILTLNAFSIPNLRMYVSGVSETRLEKAWGFAHLKEAQDYLHVCTAESSNCMKCEKCKRTLICLDVLFALDKFAKVFDLNYYREHRLEYLTWLTKMALSGSVRDRMVYGEIYSAVCEVDGETMRRIREALGK